MTAIRAAGRDGIDPGTLSTSLHIRPEKVAQIVRAEVGTGTVVDGWNDRGQRVVMIAEASVASGDDSTGEDGDEFEVEDFPTPNGEESTGDDNMLDELFQLLDGAGPMTLAELRHAGVETSAVEKAERAGRIVLTRGGYQLNPDIPL